MSHVQPAEAAIELVSVEEPAGLIGFGRIEGRQMHLAGASRAALPGLAMALVDQQPMQPGLEAVRVAESSNVTPGGDERLLGRVLGRRFVVQDQPRDDQEATDRDARQLTERVVIAAHRPLHEIPVHRASACARPFWSCYSL